MTVRGAGTELVQAEDGTHAPRRSPGGQIRDLARQEARIALIDELLDQEGFCAAKRRSDAIPALRAFELKLEAASKPSPMESERK